MEDDMMVVWSGDRDRELRVQRACPCGCDERDGPLADGRAVGYLTGSTPEGQGFTLYIPTEEAFTIMQKVIG